MCQSSVTFAAICRHMAGPSSLADGDASATSFVVLDTESTLDALGIFMGEIGSPIESCLFIDLPRVAP